MTSKSVTKISSLHTNSFTIITTTQSLINQGEFSVFRKDLNLFLRIVQDDSCDSLLLHRGRLVNTFLKQDLLSVLQWLSLNIERNSDLHNGITALLETTTPTRHNMALLIEEGSKVPRLLAIFWRSRYNRYLSRCYLKNTTLTTWLFLSKKVPRLLAIFWRSRYNRYLSRCYLKIPR